jgi:hypothetical protein
MQRMRMGALAAVTAVMALAACGQDGTYRDGAMSVSLTDAPGGNITHAVVTIEQVYLQPGGDSAGASGRVVLMDSARTVDLLTLADSAMDLFRDVTVPGGVYAQLRFVVSGGYLEVDQGDGTTKVYASSPDYAGLPPGTTVDGTLQMPSFAQTGIKVQLPGGMLRIDGDQRFVLVDFDVAQSFGHGAGPDTWVMHPVIRGADVSTTGSVHGTVRLGTGVTLADSAGLGAFQVSLDGEVQALVALEGGAYGFEFPFLLPGSHQLELIAPAGVSVTTTPALPLGVTVSGGASTAVDITITGVE